MLKKCWNWLLMVGFLLAGSHTVLSAEEADPVPPANRPDPAALREKARNLSPEQRQKLVREFRDKNSSAGTNRSVWEKRREELKKLPPKQREARLKEMREEIQKGRRDFKLLSTDERESKRTEMKNRIDAQIAELKKQKAEGSMTDSDLRRLERMQQVSARLARGTAGEGKRPQAQKAPAASETDVLPPPRPDKKN